MVQESSQVLPKVYSIAGLAGHLTVSRRTIVRALSSGDLEHYRVGARALISEQAAVAWLESQRVGRRIRRSVST